MYEVIPCNRYVLIERIEKEKEEEKAPDGGSIYIPEDVSREIERYVLCRVLGVSDGSTLGISKGEKIVVEGHLIEDIGVDGQTFCLVSEHGVKSIVRKGKVG